jgi:hypothetical protein
MAKHRHLEINQAGTTSGYVSTSGGGSEREYRYPARNPAAHAAKLRDDLTKAQAEATQREPGLRIKDIILEFFGPAGVGIESEKLDDRRAEMELLSVRQEGGVTYATVFVPEEGIPAFLRKIEEFETKTTSKGEPQNKPLMESIEGIRLPVLRSFWTDEQWPFPDDPSRSVWWEVWLRRSAVDQAAVDHIPTAFRSAAERAGLRIIRGVSVFPERVVFLVHGSPAQWAGSLSLLLPLAELRRASEVPGDYVKLPPKDQRDWIAAAVARIVPPPADAPAVSLMDTGCNHSHLLLRPALDESDCHFWNPEWRSALDNAHGTEMAGIALYGPDLVGILAGSEPIVLSHRLESVKFLNENAPHDPENYGNVTVEAVALAESHRPNRKRVVCMMTTTDTHSGDEPQSWSAMLDQHAAGQMDDMQRLYVLSVGNVRHYLSEPYAYPEGNRTLYGVEDPAQAYNALSVGGYTERATLSAELSGRECIAPFGGLSPLSRTSMMWDRRIDEENRTEWSEWPFKPDVVMEAGNYLRDEQGRPEACDDLLLLTTRVAPPGQLLTTTGDTSAATAQAAKLAAELMAAYPSLWPETLRGLIVHSAEWKQRMLDEFTGPTREFVRRRLRCYGYGVPNAERARYTVSNHVTLIVQDSLQPFKKEGSDYKTNEYKLHALPWPKEVLEQLLLTDVMVKVTLSYFIEPSPGRRGFTSKFRYASHGLRFGLRGPTESDDEFAKRISRDAWTEEEKKRGSERTVDRPDTGEPQNWAIGSQVRTRGSIHCDWWTAPATDVARCGGIAVYPVTGWWRERPHLLRYDRKARYALIVTLSTADEFIDLYTPIAQQIGVPVPIST